MLIPPLTWVLCLTSLLLCAVGFYSFVWFMSVGYGLAVAGLGLTIGVIGAVWGTADLPVLLLCLLCLVYGLRLGLFLLLRELKSADYRKTLAAQTGKKVPIFVEVVMWLMLAALYVVQTSALWYRVANAHAGQAVGGVWGYLGAAVMLAGIALEAVADRQKSAAKRVNPHMPAMTGLYKYSRCPNYFGEMTFWTGLTLSGIGAVKGAQWILVLFGWVAIVAIMVSGAQRLERRHNKNYGDDPTYRKYADTTPILVPFLPIYHLVKEERK